MKVKGLSYLRCSCFLRDRSGAVAIIAGIAVPVLLGAGALAVDVAHSRAVQAMLQKAADAAALAASQKLPDTAAATTAALDLASKNVPGNYGTVLTASDISYGTFNSETQVFTAGASPPNAVQLKTSRLASTGNAAPNFFGKVFGRSSTDISTASTAYRDLGPTYCVFVLDASANAALSISGAGTFSVPNCGVQVNSSHTRSATSGGGGTASAKAICTVGGYQGSFSPVPTTGCQSLPDPLASVPEPAAPNGGTCSTWTATPAPNQTYCGTISITTNTTLSPGTYYFKGATVTVGSNANVSGDRVLMFFDAASTLDMNTSGTVSLSAPSGGTYKGISILQSRSAPTNNVMKITGSSNFLLNGTLYMPRASLQLTGNSDLSMNSRSGYVIANRLSYTGSSTFTVGAWGGAQGLGIPVKASLVE